MSKLNLQQTSSIQPHQNHQQLKLNIIHKNNPNLKISLIANSNLSISHLKRKIQSQFSQLYNIQIVIKVLQDINGFIISNNSIVQQHFQSGNTIYFQQHDKRQKNGSNMNLVNNIGEILSTIRFVTSSALQKLDRIDLNDNKCNILEIVGDLLHIGFWHNNANTVQKLYKIFNKIFSQSNIQKFTTQASQIQMSLFLKNFTFWLSDIPNSIISFQEIIWQLVQLLQKLSYSQKFIQIIKNHKLAKCVLQLSKNVSVSNQVKKICVRVVKNINIGGGRGGLGSGSGMNKVKSQYIPSMLQNSNINGYNVQDVLDLLCTGSPDEKLTALQYLAQNNFQLIEQATIRSDYYQKLTHIFTIKKLKTKKHIIFFNQCLSKIIANTTKDQSIQIIQKDILKKIHNFMLQSSVQTHGLCLDYISKITKISANNGMFNLQKCMQYFKSPYPQFLKLIVSGILIMSQKLNNVSSIRFIPGIRDYITLCLKTNQEHLSLDLLKIISNISLDQQCRYQILNLKGIDVFVKFLEISKNQEICRVAAKGLLNLAISSRQNKAKVLGSMTSIIQRYYRMQFDSITHGYIETILKSKNL